MYLDPNQSEEKNKVNPQPIANKGGPTWSQMALVVVVLLAGFYIYSKEYASSTPADVAAVKRQADPAVVRLGFDAMVAAKLAPYEALKNASNIDLKTTGEYGSLIHDKLNTGYDSAWALWAKEMVARFGETSTTELSPTKQRELRDYFADIAEGVKKAK